MSHEKEVNNYFATNLAYLRKVRGWSQMELSKMIGLKTPRSIFSYEKGQLPTFKNLLKIKQVFGVSYDDLIKKDLTDISFRR